MPTSTQRRRGSLAAKIKNMVFVTSVSVLLTASIFFIALEWGALRTSLIDRVSLSSELIAEHLTAAISFGDMATAEKFLGSLRNDVDIEYATILVEGDHVFASYQAREGIIISENIAAIRAQDNPSNHYFSLSALYHWQTISLNDQQIGILFLKVSLRSFWLSLLAYGGVMLVMIAAMIYILERVSRRFQESISKPISTILERMSDVKSQGDYSIRIEDARTDELGDIMYQFNDMVAEIESRDRELIEKKAEIEKHAFYDPLTELPNRRLLSEQLKHEILGTKRTKAIGAVFYIDLDNFKTINDSLGHDTGDNLLKEVSCLIKSNLRNSDICARLGGDEFLAVLPDLSDNNTTAADYALSIAEQLRRTLTTPVRIGERYIHTSASIGISLFNEGTESSQDVLKQSDMAMYAAKQAGRNCIHFFSDAMQEEAINRLNLEEELREALLEPWKYLELYYQPQIDKEGKCIGAEGLIRWNHPVHGVVMPGKFIPLAEITGLIMPLGKWVIECACRQLEIWQREGKSLKLAINISSNHFLSDGFAEEVKNKIKEYQVSPLSLEIEITESLILDDKDKAVEVMAELRSCGVTFSIDDFGTGYSSLQYLTSLPISKLKIDQSFVRDITIDKHDAAIVKTIILMTQNLGLQVIAEGVEHPAEHAFLLENGCELFQGYLFSKPIGITEFEKQYISDRHLVAVK